MLQQFKINFPKITNVSLTNFSLYISCPDASIDINKNVFCLIGANGLGKSTFLNSVIFAITGAIPTSGVKFLNSQDYYKNVMKEYNVDEYYDGRVDENKRENASINVILEWPTHSISITRNFFGKNKLRKISVTDRSSNNTRVYDLINTDDLERKYKEEILHLCGLNDFSQFFFIYHFIVLFDESRHLLIWDQNALNNALYLAFGSNPDHAKEADRLKREMDREDSRARNAKYSARLISQRMNLLLDTFQTENLNEHLTDEEVEIQFNSLLKHKNNAEENVIIKQNELKDAKLRWSELQATLSTLQIEYNKTFSSRLNKSSPIEYHPIIQASLSECRCGLCGNEDSAHLSRIKIKIEDGRCPLCSSSLYKNNIDEKGIIEKLKDIDSRMASIRNSSDDMLKKIERYTSELSVSEDKEKAASDAFNAFEKDHSNILKTIDSHKSNIVLHDRISEMENSISEFNKQAQIHYKNRNDIRAKLRVSEKELKGRYNAHAESFVMRFRELAESFIGLPVDVILDHRNGKTSSGFSLILELNDHIRSTSDKLSESQRFFIDIALRMALSEFMFKGKSTLIIDTPEGSLDIAYEARAGSMFSKFATEGNTIVMTANLRSSYLVLRLSELQKSKKMQIVRMTDWTKLTDVQKSEEELFYNAYKHIESALME
ncbi:AAA family ATPase [Aeromonas caviae]|uniref:AAA family ATPase n=1 Tax=Aeromonas caviae TaxID=648 RepID=UPI001CEFB48F|nr:AAA family ATPase [Aeromonas caviae]UCM50382.1 AAA family ATPase [Aeromonas caviae]